MGKKLLFFLVSFWVISFLQAQPGKEAWHWYFGNKCKIDFSSGTPVVGMGPSLFLVGEGCAAISDENSGQYLFSVAATRVFNKNNATMYNGTGLLGATNSTQSNLIIPKPDSSNIFFVFTADYVSGLNNNGIHYSIVDLSKQNGLGAVTIKNQSLIPTGTTERLAAVRHCNGKDYWLITHLNNSNTFWAFPITSSGIGSPIISNVGTNLQYYGLYNYTYGGYLKATPDGKKLAIGVFSDSIPIVEMYDFDNLNGVITNPLAIAYPGHKGPYGLSFSPDNSKLYVAPMTRNYDTSFVYQYDISSGIPSTILASQVLIVKRPMMVASDWIAAMQIGPDGKIYIDWAISDTVAVIHNPDNSGVACNFQSNGLLMPSGTQVNYGLPNFIDANYAGIQINIPDIQQCNTFTTTTLDAGPGFTNYFWNTGANTQTISINSPGKYWVTVTNQQGCTRTDTVNAYLITSEKVDTLVCDTFHANITQSGILQYNWFDGNHFPIRDFTQSGNYYVDVNYVSGCSIRDSLNITVAQSPQIDLGPDTSFCKGDLQLNAACNGCTYFWSGGESSASIVAKVPGKYCVHVVDANGCAGSDTLVVNPQLSFLDLALPNIVTPNGDNINDVIDFGKYQFSQFTIEIFNRWGQKVFSSEDPKTIWKPTGDEGTYFYLGNSRIDCDKDSRSKELKGYITLVR